MSTTDTVFLIITACAISLFFLLAALAAYLVARLIKDVRHVVGKAEVLIDSVESATATFKHIGENASTPLAFLKVISNIVKLVNRK